MKILKWLLVSVVAVVLLVAVAGLLVMHFGFHALVNAPRVAHDEFPELQRGVRLMIQPRQAQNLLRRQLDRAATDLPPWLVNWAADSVMPFEVTLQSVPDIAGDVVPLNLYINECRLGPMIARAVPQRLQFSRDTGFTWPATEMRELKHGALQTTGTLPLDAHTQEGMAQRWGETIIPTPLPMDKTHFIELRCDNRGGALYAFASAVLGERIARGGGNPNVGQIFARQVMDILLKDIVDAHVTGDLTGESGMTLNLRIECAQDCLEDSPEQIYQAIHGGYMKLLSIAQRSNVHLEGDTKLDGLVITGTYMTDDIQALAPLISQAGG